MNSETPAFHDTVGILRKNVSYHLFIITFAVIGRFSHSKQMIELSDFRGTDNEVRTATTHEEQAEKRATFAKA